MATYRARILATAGGVPVHNVLHVSAGTAPITGLVEDLADAWRARIVPVLASVYTFTGVEIENIATDDAAAYSSGTTGPTTGGGAGTPLPTFVCASVRLVTARRGRAGAGRLGLGPIEESATTTSLNHLSAGAQGQYKASFEQFMTDIASSGGDSPMTLAVVSYYKGVDALGKPIKRATPLITPVESCSVNGVLGTRLSRHPNR